MCLCTMLSGKCSHDEVDIWDFPEIAKPQTLGVKIKQVVRNQNKSAFLVFSALEYPIKS